MLLRRSGPIKVDSKWGFVNRELQFVIPLQFDLGATKAAAKLLGRYPNYLLRFSPILGATRSSRAESAVKEFPAGAHGRPSLDPRECDSALRVRGTRVINSLP